MFAEEPAWRDRATALAARTYELTDFMAVSYTHLRAHETVLDIVCRLLLEKKKNHTSSQQIPHTYNL